MPPGLFIDWLEDTPAMYELGNYIEFHHFNSDVFGTFADSMNRFAIGTMSVSYTHLDVYKRQGLKLA